MEQTLTPSPFEMLKNLIIPKPEFLSVPLAEGLAWTGGEQRIFQEKIDGVWASLEWRGALLVGERTRDGVFHAFDCLRTFEAGDIAQRPLADRLLCLHLMASQLEREGLHDWRPVASGNGGEFLEAVLARGGEGVVCKSLLDPFGAVWVKCKRLQVYYGIVRDLRPGTASVRVDLVHRSFLDAAAGSPEDYITGDDGGWVQVGARFEALKIGDVIKLEAFGQHPSGRLREARLDNDTETSWRVG